MRHMCHVSVSGRLHPARIGGDVLAIVHTFKANPCSSFVRRCHGCLNRSACGGHAENAATTSNNRVPFPKCASVKDLHTVNTLRICQPSIFTALPHLPGYPPEAITKHTL